MTAFLDTNVPVRHLTGEPPEMAGRATSYLRSASELLLTADRAVVGASYPPGRIFLHPRGRFMIIGDASETSPTELIAEQIG